MSWDDILADPEFQAQPTKIKAEVATNYFKQNIADKDFLRQPPEIQAQVKTNFYGTLQEKPDIWNGQIKPTLLETGKQIFEIPKTIGDVALGFGGGALGWGLGSIAGIAEGTQPGATRESVQQARENIEKRLSFEPQTQPGQILMEKAGRLMNAVTQPAAEASFLVGESWDSPLLESILKFAGEAATFEALGKATNIRPNIKAPEWYRRMTIPERGLVEGIKADLSSGQFTPDQIRQLWKDPANRAELLKRYQGVGEPAPEQAGTFAPETPPREARLSNPIIADALLKAAREKALPGPEGMDMNIGQDFTVTPSRALADMIIRSGRGRLPAGQTPMLPEPPASSPVAPEIALLAALTRKHPALPAGQGFEVVGNEPRGMGIEDLRAMGGNVDAATRGRGTGIPEQLERLRQALIEDNIRKEQERAQAEALGSPEDYLRRKMAEPKVESDAFDMTRPFERGKIEFEAPEAEVKATVKTHTPGIAVADADAVPKPTTIKGFVGEHTHNGVGFIIQKVKHGYRAYNYDKNPIMTKEFKTAQEAIAEAQRAIDAQATPKPTPKAEGKAEAAGEVKEPWEMTWEGEILSKEYTQVAKEYGEAKAAFEDIARDYYRSSKTTRKRMDKKFSESRRKASELENKWNRLYGAIRDFKEGKPVPPEVLKDYPELAKPAESATIPAVTKKPGTANIPAKEKPLAEAEDYRISHRPNPEGPPAHDLLSTDIAPDDIYDNPQFYTGDPRSKGFKESVSALRAIRNNPDATVTIYRASPKKELNKGDWVSFSRDYAKREGMADNPSDDIPVHSFKVKAKDVRWAGDSIEEFGYYPETTPKVEAGYSKVKGQDVIGRDIPDWRGATVYHATSKAGFDDISKRGYRILGEEAEDGQGGYYGEAVSFTPTKTYAEQFGDVLTRAKLPDDIKILNLNDPKDWDIYLSITKGGNDLSRLREYVVKAGYDGLYDAGAGDLFLYNPEKAKLLPNPSRPPEVGGQKLLSSERGSTGDLSQSEIVAALRKTKDSIDTALPHLERLGRSIYESGKTDLRAWATAMKRTLGDLWDSFKDVMVKVWRTVSKPIRNERGAVGVDINAADKGSDIYARNRAMQSKGVAKTAREELREVADDIKLLTDEYFGAISTRLENIHPQLRVQMRKMEMNAGTEASKAIRRVEPMLQKIKGMAKEDRIDFDLARKNGDAPKLKELIDKYKMWPEYTNGTRAVLNELHEKAKAVGFDVGYLKHFHPRVIKDPKGFLAYFRNQADWPVLEMAIRAKETELGRYLEIDEKASLINKLLRGYRSGQISLSKPGQLKSREIGTVTPELNRYYMDSDAALLRYISTVTDAIEMRRAFGVTKKGAASPQDTIGHYILGLLERGIIRPEDEPVLRSIYNARFNEQGTRGVIGLYKNLSYIDTMGSPISAITQIGDLAWALYKNGIVPTARAAGKATAGKSAITKEDIGIDMIAKEFADTSKASRAVRHIFDWIGLSKIDNIGKESLINSTINEARKKARDPKKVDGLRKELQPIFEGETDSLIKDLADGKITENVKLYAFNTLSDFQPISLSEMPQKYLTGGNGRIFYMLKSFTLKQFDVYRREVFRNIGREGTRLKGLKNLLFLSAAFIAANASADVIKALILNRDIDPGDLIVDNLARLAGISKYTVWKARTEGTGSALVRTIAPPFKLADSLTKDIATAGNGKGLETPQSIPMVGKLYYWWFGKGADKEARRAERQRNNPAWSLLGPSPGQDLSDKVRRSRTRTRTRRRARSD